MAGVLKPQVLLRLLPHFIFSLMYITTWVDSVVVQPGFMCSSCLPPARSQLPSMPLGHNANTQEALYTCASLGLSTHCVG